MEEGDRRKGDSDNTQQGLKSPSQALYMKEGNHEPKNWGGL